MILKDFFFFLFKYLLLVLGRRECDKQTDAIQIRVQMPNNYNSLNDVFKNGDTLFLGRPKSLATTRSQPKHQSFGPPVMCLWQYEIQMGNELIKIKIPDMK